MPFYTGVTRSADSSTAAGAIRTSTAAGAIRTSVRNTGAVKEATELAAVALADAVNVVVQDNVAFPAEGYEKVGEVVILNEALVGARGCPLVAGRVAETE